MSQPDYADLIERLAIASKDAREAVREAHEARRDLRIATKEARGEITQLVSTQWAEDVKPVVVEHLVKLQEKLQQVQNDKHNQIVSAFDRMTNTLMHGDTRGRGEILGTGTPVEPLSRKLIRDATAPLKEAQ